MCEYNPMAVRMHVGAEPVDLSSWVWMRAAHGAQRVRANRAKRWSRHEKLSFVMLGTTWGVLVFVVTALHFGNSHLETKTSSTSGAHTGFHGTAASVRTTGQREASAAIKEETTQGDLP